MGEWNYNPQSDRKTDQNENIITKLPTFQVNLPYRERVAWPKKCVMCEAPATKTGSVSNTFKSANYLIARTKTTLKFDGVPYCDKCHKRYNLSPIQGIFILLGLLIGAGVFVASFFIDGFPICMGCGAGSMIFILFFLLGVLIIGGGLGSSPVQMEVRTEGNQIGKDRPVELIFKFRNKKYSDDFRELNMPKQERYDLW